MLCAASRHPSHCSACAEATRGARSSTSTCSPGLQVAGVSLTEIALVANARTARLGWGDVRSRVFLNHRAKRVKRVSRFWIGDRRGKVRPFLELPPWVQTGSNPASALLEGPQSAWELWRQRPRCEPSGLQVGDLSAAWADPQRQQEADTSLEAFIRLALDALCLVADRQLAELWADLPAGGPGAAERGPQTASEEDVKLLARVRSMRDCLTKLRGALGGLAVSYHELHEGAGHPPAGGSRPVGPAAGAGVEPSAQEASEVTTVAPEQRRLAIDAVLKASRGDTEDLRELLEASRHDGGGLREPFEGAGAGVREEPGVWAVFRRRLQLLVHPDKAPEDLKALATQAFQQLPVALDAVRESLEARQLGCEQGGVQRGGATAATSTTLQGDAAIEVAAVFEAAREMCAACRDVRSKRSAAIEKALLAHSLLVFSTLSASGRPLLQGQGVQTIIIDEACQSTEDLSLIPLHRHVQHVVLIGDPQQLPPTVKSKAAQELLYGRSTFERLVSAGCSPRLLDIQYRMHPDILAWPNDYFYGSKVRSSASVLRRGAAGRPSDTHLPQEMRERCGALRVFDTSRHHQAREQSDGRAVRNIGEAQLLLEHVRRFVESRSGTDELTVGIITPYRAQVQLFEELLQDNEYTCLKAHVKVSTVDGFQGKECDVVAISSVRTGESIGFVRDPRRLNVAITRARLKCWIFGNLTALEQDAEVWRDFAGFARESGWVIDASSPATDLPYTRSSSVPLQGLNVADRDAHPCVPRPLARPHQAPATTGGGNDFRLVELHPFEIFFTHDTIRPKFRDGGVIDDAIRSIINGNRVPQRRRCGQRRPGRLLARGSPCQRHAWSHCAWRSTLARAWSSSQRGGACVSTGSRKSRGSLC